MSKESFSPEPTSNKEKKQHTNFGDLTQNLRKSYKVSSMELARRQVITYRQERMVRKTSRNAKMLDTYARNHPNDLYDLLNRLAFFEARNEAGHEPLEQLMTIFDQKQACYQQALFYDIGTTCELPQDQNSNIEEPGSKI